MKLKFNLTNKQIIAEKENLKSFYKIGNRAD